MSVEFDGWCTNMKVRHFTDGVLAIIITIMVLEMKVPRGVDLGSSPSRPSRIHELCAELRLHWHLLEPWKYVLVRPGKKGKCADRSEDQPSSYAAYDAQRNGRDVFEQTCTCFSGFLSSPLQRCGWVKIILH